MSKTVKLIIVIAVIIALVVIGATFVTQPEGGTSGLQSVTTGNNASPLTQTAVTDADVANTQEINREFVSMLLNLRSITLNDDIFSEPAFQALTDNTIRLNQPGNEGRSNPFAPIGVEPNNRINRNAPTSQAAGELQEQVDAQQDLAVEEAEETETEEASTQSASEFDSSSQAEVNTAEDTSAAETNTNTTNSSELTEEELQEIFSNLGNS
jgi:hypothetical protein